MTILAIILMWVWFAIACVLISRSPMGKECGRRTAYWSRFEGK